MRQIIVGVLAALFAAGPAAADDSALNEEGFWTVGRGDAQAKGCMASVTAKDGTTLIFQVAPGHADVVVATAKPMRRGKAGVLTIDETRFEFAPEYAEKSRLMFFQDVGSRAFAALRGAHGLMVRVDEREVVSADLDGTGVDSALDAALACSTGKSGWWGPGVGAMSPDAPATPEARAKPSYKDEGLWTVEADRDICSAVAAIDDGKALVLLAFNGGRDVVVGSGDQSRKRARKGLLETDAFSVSFKPAYDGDEYFQTAQPLDSQSLLALRRAKWLRIRLDGRQVLDAALEGSSFPDVLTSLTNCAAGKRGWWGEGAKTR